MLIDRESELEELNLLLAEPRASLLAVTGRSGGQEPAEGGDAAVTDERPGLPSHPKAGADNRRPGRIGADRDGTPGRGDPVPAEAPVMIARHCMLPSA